MANQNKSFVKYLKIWEVEHRIYLDKLLVLANRNELESEESLNDLVERVLCHYQVYFNEKSKATESDVFLMFSPPWFSSFEKTLLWASGFKPSIAFQLLKNSVGGELNEEQNRRIGVVRDETRWNEKDIAQALASVQESVAAQPFYGLVKREGSSSLVAGEVTDMENAVEELEAAMLKVMRNADYLRQHTVGLVLEVLSPLQKVKFLAKTSQLWLHSKRLGVDIDHKH